MPSTSVFSSVQTIANQPEPTFASVNPQVVISFDDLSAFEIVQNQYFDLGIRFNNAVAVQPTNPLFRTDRMGIMPMGEQMKLTIAFEIPLRRVRLVLTGAGVIHTTLFDAEHRPLTQTFSSRLPMLPPKTLPQSEKKYSAFEAIVFPQYELSFRAVKHGESQAISAIHQVQLKSASPFVLQLLAIEFE